MEGSDNSHHSQHVFTTQESDSPILIKFSYFIIRKLIHLTRLNHSSNTKLAYSSVTQSTESKCPTNKQELISFLTGTTLARHSFLYSMSHTATPRAALLSFISDDDSLSPAQSFIVFTIQQVAEIWFTYHYFLYSHHLYLSQWQTHFHPSVHTFPNHLHFCSLLPMLVLVFRIMMPPNSSSV